MDTTTLPSVSNRTQWIRFLFSLEKIKKICYLYYVYETWIIACTGIKFIHRLLDDSRGVFTQRPPPLWPDLTLFEDQEEEEQEPITQALFLHVSKMGIATVCAHTRRTHDDGGERRDMYEGLSAGISMVSRVKSYKALYRYMDTPQFLKSPLRGMANLTWAYGYILSFVIMLCLCRIFSLPETCTIITWPGTETEKGQRERGVWEDNNQEIISLWITLFQALSLSTPLTTKLSSTDPGLSWKKLDWG